MSRTMGWVLITLVSILLACVLVLGVYWLYTNKFKKPQTVSQETTTTESQVSETQETEKTTESEKTIKDVHCLQKPTKGTQITIENLTDYSIVKSPLTFTGKANAFESTFNYKLKDCRGPVLSEGSITAEGEMGTMAPYTKTITFTLSRVPMDAILEVFELSVADGSVTNLYQVPLRLTR